MSVSTPIPNVTAAQALARQHGQTVEARVIGQLPNGQTEVQVGRQTLSLQLPTQQPVGTTLTLAVQQVDGQVRLSLVSAAPPPSPMPLPPVSTQAATPSPSFNAPATRVELSPLAQNVTQAPVGQSNGGAPTTPQVAQGQNAAPVTPQPPQNYAQTSPQFSNPQAGARPDAPPQVPIATAVPTYVRAQVPYTAPPMPVIAAVDAGGAAQLGDRPPFGMATSGQQFTQANLGAPARAEGVQINTSGPAAPQTAQVQTPAATQAAISQMVSQAMPKQNSVAALNTVIAAVAGRVPLPRDVLTAAQGVLGQQLVVDGDRIDPLALKSAIGQSGIFHEAKLGAGQAQAAGGDLKASLMGLQRSLSAWLGSNAAMIERVSQLPPPLKGLHPRVLPNGQNAEDIPREPKEVGKLLLERTEASLARLRLHQHASTPEQTQTVGRPEQLWSMDIPVHFAGQQTLLNLQIQGEPEAEDVAPEDRSWQVRFAIHLAGRGEVGAQLSLRGKRTNVLIWAEEESTGQALKAHVEQLQTGLEAVGLVPGAVIVRVGAPASPTPSPVQHFVDATT